MTLSDGPIRQAALRIGPRAGVVLVAAVLFWLAAYLMPAGLAQLTLGLVGATLALVAIWVWSSNVRWRALFRVSTSARRR